MWIGAQRRGVQQHVIVIVAVFVSIIQGHKMLSMRLGIKILSNVPLYHLYSMYPLIRNIQMEFPHQVQQYRFKGQIIIISFRR